MNQALWLTPIILATWEAEIRWILVQSQPRKIVLETPISKTTRTKWTGGVAQAADCLLCKCETLSSNPSPTKKKQNKENIKNTFICSHQVKKHKSRRLVW
jgi:hypothetical protein